MSSRFIVSEMRSIMFIIFKNKSTSGVGYPNTSADPSPFPSICANGWSSRVVRHQETSVEKERQARKREADREITEAPPQSLAFSCGGEIKSRKPLATDSFDDRITLCHQPAARADLRVVGVTGLGPSANLLRPHPVALHRGVMCNGVKVAFRPVFRFLLQHVILLLQTDNSIKGYISPPWAPW